MMTKRTTKADNFEVGTIHEGVVTGLQDYGAFVQIGRRSGLCHRSMFAEAGMLGGLNIGIAVKVKVLAIRSDKKLSLELLGIASDVQVSKPRDLEAHGRRAATGAMIGDNLRYNKSVESVLREGVKDINDVGRRYAKNTSPSRTGFVVESDAAATMNVDAAFKRSKVRAERVGSTGQNSPDIRLKDANGKVVKQISSKVYKTSEATANAQRGYPGQERLVPKDQHAEVKKYAAKREVSESAKGKPTRTKVADEYREVAEQATDHLELDDIKSEARTRAESKALAEKAKEGRATGADIVGDLGGRMMDGAKQGAKTGAAASALIGGATSTFYAVKDVRDGKKAPLTAVKDVAQGVAVNAIDGAVKGAASGAATAGARVLAERAASQTVKKVLGGSAPAAVAIAGVEIAKHAIDLARGVKTADEFFAASAETAIGGSASFIGAEVGFLIGGPVGAIIGGIAGPWLVDAGRSWFGKASENTVGLSASLDQLLQLNTLPGHDESTIYHMTQMRGVVSALAASDAVLFPDRVVMADRMRHATAEIVLAHRGRIYVADFKAWKGRLNFPEIVETKTVVERGWLWDSKREVKVGTGLFDKKTLIQAKMDPYGIEHEKSHRNPISGLKHFSFYLKRRLMEFDSRWKRVPIMSLAIFPDGDVTLSPEMVASGNFMMFSEFRKLLAGGEDGSTPSWMLNGLSTTPTWDVLEDERGNLYQGLIETKSLALHLSDGTVDVPFSTILKIEAGNSADGAPHDVAFVTLHDKSMLTGVVETPEIVLNRKGHSRAYPMRQLKKICPAFTYFS